jgi:biotin synthase
LDVDFVLAKAKEAKDNGATRFCMGASWRDIPKNKQFDDVLEMVRGVRALGMEACCTLGMLTQDQADRLAEAGLTAYNHNLDTSPEYYDKVVTTRTYQERLDTLSRVRNSGVTLCTGGIIGIGETVRDRVRMLEVLASHDPHPESVPINGLARVPGTPLADSPEIEPLEMARMIATARIAMPASMVRFAAGRTGLSHEAQALCFMAGANSIFSGDKLLTTPNPGEDHDKRLLEKVGLTPMEMC